MTSTFGGRLLTFHSDPFLKIPVFITGTQERLVLWLGGQCDGFFVLTYMPTLAQEIEKIGWSLAQLMTSSAFVGHSNHTHCHDAEELDDLIGSLVKEHQVKEIALFASSTGVQVALEFLESGSNAEVITRVMLQGIVCDPEDQYFTPEAAAKRVTVAQELLYAGRGEEVDEMRRHYDIPVTAARASKGGYLSVMEAFWLPAYRKETVQLAKILSSIRVPLMIMLAVGKGYHVSAEDRAGFGTIMKAAASTSELEVVYFNDVSDERRRLLKAEDARHTTSIVFFLSDQDNKREERRRQEEAEMAENERRNRSVLAKSNLRLM